MDKHIAIGEQMDKDINEFKEAFSKLSTKYGDNIAGFELLKLRNCCKENERNLEHAKVRVNKLKETSIHLT